MSKVDIKNINGGVLTFPTFRDIQIDEIILIANETVLGPEIEEINKEFPLNTFDVCLYDGRLKLLVDDTEVPEGNQSVKIFDEELQLTENLEKTTILRANSLITQPITDELDGTIVTFENVIENHGVSVLNGEITGEKTATYKYDLELNLDVIKGFGGVIESWFEFEHPSYGWLLYTNSGKKKDFDKQSEGYLGYSGVLNLIAGIKFRLKVRCGTNKTDVKLLAETLTNGVGVVSAGITVH
jgi:hypothetical protein